MRDSFGTMVFADQDGCGDQSTDAASDYRGFHAKGYPALLIGPCSDPLISTKSVISLVLSSRNEADPRQFCAGGW